MAEADFRYRKVYPRDVTRPTVRSNWNTNIRLGSITAVQPLKGTCTISWLDRPGGRVDVLLTQGNPNDFVIPTKGTAVIVGFDKADQARILGYINLAYANKVSKKELPELKEGEKLWEVGGSYIWMKQNGDITVNIFDGINITYENNGSTIKEESLNSKRITEAGVEYRGIVKRYNSATSSFDPVYRVDPTSPFTEHRYKYSELADGQTGLTKVDSPFIDLCIGTYVTDEGDVVNKKDKTTSLYPEKELAVRIVFKNGTKLFIDKEGRVSLSAKSININNGEVDSDDKDISKNLETGSTKGAKGMHAAREHDKVTIPISSNYVDNDHTGLKDKGTSNLTALQTLAAAIISPAGPCSLNTALLTGNLELLGEITEGATNIYLGDE